MTEALKSKWHKEAHDRRVQVVIQRVKEEKNGS